MSKIVTRKRYRPHIPQTMSALITILAINTSNLQVSTLSKAIIYVCCFLLNFKLIEMCVNGYQIEIDMKDWQKMSEKAKQMVISKIYDEVKTFVIDNQKASESMIERVFKVDYEIANALIEKLEKEGVVGPYTEDKPRKVLISKK